jgi:Arc/MetJ-type ribon-helix-helix transcriptional regulator
MPKTKVAVTIDSELLARIDALVEDDAFPNRSQAIEIAIEEKLGRMAHAGLARECAKLDRAEERALAEEGLSRDVAEWPAY